MECMTGLVLALFRGFFKVFIFNPLIDTRLPQGFTEDNFNKIQLQMTQAEMSSHFQLLNWNVLIRNQVNLYYERIKAFGFSLSNLQKYTRLSGHEN